MDRVCNENDRWRLQNSVVWAPNAHMVASFISGFFFHHRIFLSGVYSLFCMKYDSRYFSMNTVSKVPKVILTYKKNKMIFRSCSNLWLLTGFEPATADRTRQVLYHGGMRNRYAHANNSRQ